MCDLQCVLALCVTIHVKPRLAPICRSCNEIFRISYLSPETVPSAENYVEEHMISKQLECIRYSLMSNDIHQIEFDVTKCFDFKTSSSLIIWSLKPKLCLSKLLQIDMLDAPSNKTYL